MDKGWYALVIMLANDGFDGLCACHCGLFAHQSGYGTQAISADTSELPEKGWAYAVLCLKLVHNGEVLLLLVPHVLRCFISLVYLETLPAVRAHLN